MHGTDETELNAYLIRDENFTSPKASWRRDGDHGRHWQHAQLQIDPASNITRVIFEVVAIFSIRSEVSLDDISLVNGPCVSPDFYSISCTFEDDHICGYTSNATGKLNWVRHSGGTPTGITGPMTGKFAVKLLAFCKTNFFESIDHTLGTYEGYYMFIGKS